MNTKEKWAFYSIYDRNKEWIDRKEFNSYDDALRYFSKQKKLPIFSFLKIYSLIKIDQ